MKIVKNKIIKHPKGNIYKILSNKNLKVKEIYASKINFKKIKAWKLNKKHISKLVVVEGKIELAYICNISKKVKSILIGSNLSNYKLVSIPPNTWYGFKGLHNPASIIINSINSIYKTSDAKTKKLNLIKFRWKKI